MRSLTGTIVVVRLEVLLVRCCEQRQIKSHKTISEGKTQQLGFTLLASLTCNLKTRNKEIQSGTSNSKMIYIFLASYYFSKNLEEYSFYCFRLVLI